MTSVAVAFTTPMSYLIGGGSIYIEGRPASASSQPPASFMNHVGHGYFDVMGIPIVRGRAFVEDDEREHSTTRKVAIVNEAMAAKYWPGQDAVGKRFHAYNPAEPLLEIVGVARDSKYVLVFEAPRPYIYLPLVRDMSLRTLHVRAAGEPALLAPRLEREIKDLAPDLPIADLRTMHQSLAGIFGYLIFRVGAIQATGMGVLGLTLALIGVYGVVSFGASLRTREIGIRVALGAQPRDILRLMLGQGLQLVAAGVVVGLAASVAMARVLSRFLPLVDAADWITFAGVAAGLAALALWACYLPARRATRVPVMTALTARVKREQEMRWDQEKVECFTEHSFFFLEWAWRAASGPGGHEHLVASVHRATAAQPRAARDGRRDLALRRTRLLGCDVRPAGRFRVARHALSDAGLSLDGKP